MLEAQPPRLTSHSGPHCEKLSQVPPLPWLQKGSLSPHWLQQVVERVRAGVTDLPLTARDQPGPKLSCPSSLMLALKGGQLTPSHPAG